MAKLYRDNILAEKPLESGFVAIGSIAPAAPAPRVKAEETVAGD